MMEIKEGPILNELLKAQLFFGLGNWQSVIFQGASPPKLLKFFLANDEGGKMLHLASVISKNEKMMWESFEELLARSVQSAGSSLQGIFGLDVLSADIQEGSRNFNPQDFSKLLVNHGRLLDFGQQKFIRYGQIFSLLHKRAPADWGKINVTAHVEIVNPEKTKLAGFLKKMAREGGEDDDALYLIHDLGLSPVWDLTDEEFPPNVYFYQSDRFCR